MSKRLVFVRQTPSGPIGRNAIRQGRLRSLHGSHPRWLHEHKMLHKNKIQVVTTHPLACHLHSFFTKSIQGYCFVNNSFLSPSMLSFVQPCLNASYSRCSHAELRVVVIFLNKHSFRKQNLKEAFRSLFASGGYFLSMDARHCWEPLCQWPPMWLKSLFRGHWGTYCPHRQPSPHCQTLPSPSVQPDVKECPAAWPLLQNSVAWIDVGCKIQSLFPSFWCESNRVPCGVLLIENHDYFLHPEHKHHSRWCFCHISPRSFANSFLLHPSCWSPEKFSARIWKIWSPWATWIFPSWHLLWWPQCR